jgi:diacylglycerol diphosphate phosphatase/phosphatidate phosphatase
MVPALGAALITGTRIMDARHHPFDVISGALLGILVSWGSYRQYFPPVSETWRKGRAYPIRAWGKASRVPPTPTIMIDEDVQPLRPMGKPVDEERGEASGYSSTTAVPGASDQGGNVFRQQVSDSQRRRQGGPSYGVDRSDTLASSDYRSDTMGSTISSKVHGYQNQMPSPNPFAADAARQRRMDTYDYSSSEDEDNYELQQTYTLSGPQHTNAYNPVSGLFTDTGYHPPPGISPNPTPPPPENRTTPNQQATMSPTGDLSDRREGAAPAPPPHAVGTTPQQI